MDAVNIRIFNRAIEFMGEVDDFTSLFFIRKWNSYGNFEIELDREIHGMTPGNYIMINNDPTLSGVIEYVDIKATSTSKKVTIKGFELAYLLSTRITEPPAGKGYDEFNTTVENIMVLLVDHNMRLPVNTNRKVANLGRAASQSRGQRIKFQTRYKNLLEELTSLSLMSYLGFGIELNTISKQLVFKVYQGKDLTALQTTNPPKIFSKEYDNVFDFEFTYSTENSKNTAIIAGQGEEENRVVQIVYDINTGLDRRELFVDARDIKETDNLKDRADEKLSKYQETVEYDCDIDSSDYKKAWDLGDLVTLKIKDSLTLEKQVTEVRLIFEGFSNKIEVTFGEPLTSLKDKIQEELNKPVQENGKIYYDVPQPVTSAKGTQWLEVIG